MGTVVGYDRTEGNWLGDGDVRRVGYGDAAPKHTCTYKRFNVPTQGSPNRWLLAAISHDDFPSHSNDTCSNEVLASQSELEKAPQLPYGVPYDANSTGPNTASPGAANFTAPPSSVTPHTEQQTKAVLGDEVGD